MTTAEIFEDAKREILKKLAEYRKAFEDAKDFSELGKVQIELETDIQKIFRERRAELRVEEHVEELSKCPCFACFTKDELKKVSPLEELWIADTFREKFNFSENSALEVKEMWLESHKDLILTNNLE